MKRIDGNTSEEIEGIPVYFFGSVMSTMDVAECLLKEGKTGIVVAEQQEKGRGRYGRKWFSPYGGLYLSWILKEELLYPLFLSEIISLSVVETLRYFGIDCRIKLPNDIITGGKKIAGILIVKKDNWYIAGIGINVNNPVEDRKQQVSIKDITGKEVDNKKVLEQFIKIFFHYKEDFYTDTSRPLKQWSEYLIK
ncbi:MAG: biotin--[acetyl-CoA-carboxylase] ligase [Candidatus Omnitrophica bacterium]|nr:biotin--[acetyl-CoA-carboxylase] ligase [Candidatus Omnitrophota bacterium]